jgi:hypothetical protein
MALLRRGHPWIAGYAIPQNVIDEPFHQGAIVSRYRKRKTISDPSTLRNPRSPGGYILPQSVRDEPLGQGVRTTHYRKRGTISGLVPEIVVAGKQTGRVGVGGIFEDERQTGRLGVLSGTTLGGHSVLGALGDEPPGGGRDGVAKLAKETAAMIMANSRSVAPAHRKIFVQAVLGNIDRGLPDKVAAKAALLMKDKRYDAKTALQKAIAVEVANDTLNSLVTMGKTGRVPTSGLLGLGACGCAGMQGLGFGWSDVKSAAKKTAGVVLAPATGGASLALTFPGTASKVADAAKGTLDKIGQAACKLADSGALKLGGAIGGAAAGGPQGAQAGSAGADVAQALCAKPAAPGPLPPPDSGLPIVPILIGGGVLMAVLLLA